VRRMYDRYVVGPAKEGRGAIGVGYPEDGILKALNEVTESDWKPFYDAYISGVEELPYKEVMEAAGLAPAITVLDTPDLGLDLRGTYVVFVSSGGEAEKAGIKQGDRLSAINDVEVTRTNLREMMGKLMPGEEARLQLLRGEGKFDVAITPKLKQRTTCKLRRAENPTDAQKRVLDAWLGKPREY
jgi:predicted metalloprotease with PDZ domain